MVVRIEPSILSADFTALAADVARIPSADLVHVDVMDNHFVPNLTFGLPMVERLLQVTDLPLDVHLMIDDPDRWAPGYAEPARPRDVPRRGGAGRGGDGAGDPGARGARGHRPEARHAARARTSSASTSSTRCS